jgi:hypothetical protein
LPGTSNFPGTADQTRPLPFLRVYVGDSFVRNFRIEEGTWTVGRDTDVDLCLDGKTISRRHFRIEYEGENHLYIQDLQSSNGTLLNGKKVARAPLAHGDEIQIGEYRMTISNRAFPKGTVIPFPRVKTEPGIEIEKFKSVPLPREVPAPAPVPVPSRRRPSAKPGALFRTIQVSLILLTAGAVAYVMDRFLDMRKKPAVATSPKVVRPREQPRRAPVEPKSEIPAVAEKVEEKASKQVSPPVAKEPNLTDSLRKSLGGMDSAADFSAMDQKMKSSDSRSGSKLSSLKKMPAGSRMSVDIDIDMPTSPEFEQRIQKSREAESRSGRNFDAQKYREMLRERISPVEMCYAETIKNGEGGKFVVGFSVARDGSVRKPVVDSSTFKSAALNKCVLNKLLGVRFDPPPFDGFSILFGFRFGGQKIQF